MNKFFLTAIAIISLVPAIASLTINTPAGVVQCQPTLLTWSGGTPPYYLTLLPGGQVAGEPIQSFDATDDTSKTWLANVNPGQQITFALKDSTGETAFTDQVQVRQGTDKGCMTAAPGPTDSNTASGSGTQGAVETTPAATRATNAAASKTSTTARAASTGSGASESNNAGGLSVGALELAGALGLVGVVLF
ncbi:hypothetical protein F5887DRAFT_536392 [Amanita rubescens]|nr:hypothetical protein F5887DRAFT_536392 [Amanita rubescens]